MAGKRWWIRRSNFNGRFILRANQTGPQRLVADCAIARLGNRPKTVGGSGSRPFYRAKTLLRPLVAIRRRAAAAGDVDLREVAVEGEDENAFGLFAEEAGSFAVWGFDFDHGEVPGADDLAP